MGFCWLRYPFQVLQSSYVGFQVLGLWWRSRSVCLACSGWLTWGQRSTAGYSRYVHCLSLFKTGIVSLCLVCNVSKLSQQELTTLVFCPISKPNELATCWASTRRSQRSWWRRRKPSYAPFKLVRCLWVWILVLTFVYSVWKNTLPVRTVEQIKTSLYLSLTLKFASVFRSMMDFWFMPAIPTRLIGGAVAMWSDMSLHVLIQSR